MLPLLAAPHRVGERDPALLGREMAVGHSPASYVRGACCRERAIVAKVVRAPIDAPAERQTNGCTPGVLAYGRYRTTIGLL